MLDTLAETAFIDCLEAFANSSLQADLPYSNRYCSLLAVYGIAELARWGMLEEQR